MGVVEIVPEKEVYQIGEEVKVIANVNEGYKFTGWLENNEIISTEKEYTFTVDKDRELTAQFEKEEKPVEPDKPVVPEKPNKPVAPQIPPKPDRPNEQKPSQNGNAGQPQKPVKTGDDSQSTLALFGFGISAIALAYVLGRKRK